MTDLSKYESILLNFTRSEKQIFIVMQQHSKIRCSRSLARSRIVAFRAADPGSNPGGSIIHFPISGRDIMISEISVCALQKLMAKKMDFVLLDVRESWERKICKFKDDMHIPLGNLQRKIGRIPKNKRVIVCCHHGNRSKIAANILISNGFKAASLAGGIDEWARLVDADMKRY